MVCIRSHCHRICTLYIQILTPTGSVLVTKKLTSDREDSVTGQILGVFWGNFFKNFQASSTGIFITKCTDLKNQCRPMAKICPEIKKILGFFAQKKYNITQKIFFPISVKIYPKTQNFPSHRGPPFPIECALFMNHSRNHTRFSQIRQNWHQGVFKGFGKKWTHNWPSLV